MKNNISLNEWKKALEISENNDEGYTVSELSKFLNVSRNTVIKKMNVGIEKGLIIKGTGTRYRVNSDYRKFVVTVYRIAKKGK